MHWNLFILVGLNFIHALGNRILEDPRRGPNANACGDSKRDSTSPKLLLDGKTGRCHEFGTKGPCGLNMIFYNDPREPSSPYGFCDCDQGVKSESPCSDHPVRQMIYIPRFKQCFPLFTQGPCRNGFWLNIGETDENPQCQPNPCQQQSINSRNSNDHRFWFFDPLRKSCFETQTRGYCPVGLSLEVTHTSHIPKCRRKQCHSALGRIRTKLVCKAGSRYSYYLKGCVRRLKLRF